MKDFVSFVTYLQSIYFMSTRIFKYKINGFYVLQIKISYIHDKTHLSHKNMVKLYFEVDYVWWINKYL